MTKVVWIFNCGSYVSFKKSLISLRWPYCQNARVKRHLLVVFCSVSRIAEWDFLCSKDTRDINSLLLIVDVRGILCVSTKVLPRRYSIKFFVFRNVIRITNCPEWLFVSILWRMQATFLTFILIWIWRRFGLGSLLHLNFSQSVSECQFLDISYDQEIS